MPNNTMPDANQPNNEATLNTAVFAALKEELLTNGVNVQQLKEANAQLAILNMLAQNQQSDKLNELYNRINLNRDECRCALARVVAEDKFSEEQLEELTDVMEEALERTEVLADKKLLNKIDALAFAYSTPPLPTDTDTDTDNEACDVDPDYGHSLYINGSPIRP